jgi:hypothetical protein
MFPVARKVGGVPRPFRALAWPRAAIPLSGVPFPFTKE